jgi:hypothetical protein
MRAFNKYIPNICIFNLHLSYLNLCPTSVL